MSGLSIRGLGKSFGATAALTGLDLDIAEGSRTAIVGPSGSGKTTLLRLVAGFEVPDSGEIRLDGQLIADAANGVPAHRRHIGLVMQEGALFPHLTIVDNIRFGIRNQPDSVARALGLMDLVELDRSMAGRQPHQLSGGQQQRVALARAMARQPQLMLLDEPFSALDMGLREQLREATAHILSKAGIATLLVTHDRDEAMGFADQLVVLRQGRLIQAGRPRDLYLAPVDGATASFLGSAIIVDADVSNGMASCVLGSIPVTGTTDGRNAPILVRPEQVRVVEMDPGNTGPGWTVSSLTRVGAISRLRLEDEARTTTLEFESATVPPLRPGARVSLTVEGPAHGLKR